MFAEGALVKRLQISVRQRFPARRPSRQGGGTFQELVDCASALAPFASCHPTRDWPRLMSPAEDALDSLALYPLSSSVAALAFCRASLRIGNSTRHA